MENNENKPKNKKNNGWIITFIIVFCVVAIPNLIMLNDHGPIETILWISFILVVAFLVAKMIIE